jgi:hypothetical protein
MRILYRASSRVTADKGFVGLTVTDMNSLSTAKESGRRIRIIV